MDKYNNKYNKDINIKNNKVKWYENIKSKYKE